MRVERNLVITPERCLNQPNVVCNTHPMEAYGATSSGGARGAYQVRGKAITREGDPGKASGITRVIPRTKEVCPFLGRTERA